MNSICRGCLRTLLICINADLPSVIPKLLPADVINQERLTQKYKGKDEVDTTSRHTIAYSSEGTNLALRHALLPEQPFNLYNRTPFTYQCPSSLSTNFCIPECFLSFKCLIFLMLSYCVNFSTQILFFCINSVFSLDKESGKVEESCLPFTYTLNRIFGKTYRVTVT